MRTRLASCSIQGPDLRFAPLCAAVPGNWGWRRGCLFTQGKLGWERTEMNLGVGSACRRVCALVCVHTCVHGARTHACYMCRRVCTRVLVCVWVCVAGRCCYFSSVVGTFLRASSRGTGRQPVIPHPGTLLVPCGHCPLVCVMALQSRIVTCLPF